MSEFAPLTPGSDEAFPQAAALPQAPNLAVAAGGAPPDPKPADPSERAKDALADEAMAEEWQAGADAVFGGRAGALALRGPSPLLLGRPLTLVFDAERRQVRVADSIIQLGFEEFTILAVLASRPYWPFTFQEVVDEAGLRLCRLTRLSLDEHVATLRDKLGQFGDYIQSVPGFGYRFRE
jgi:hypothetical protein